MYICKYFIYHIVEYVGLAYNLYCTAEKIHAFKCKLSFSHRSETLLLLDGVGGGLG